jgi:hypothetical protein
LFPTGAAPVKLVPADCAPRSRRLVSIAMDGSWLVIERLGARLWLEARDVLPYLAVGVQTS